MGFQNEFNNVYYGRYDGLDVCECLDIVDMIVDFFRWLSKFAARVHGCEMKPKDAFVRKISMKWEFTRNYVSNDMSLPIVIRLTLFHDWSQIKFVV